jgi:hypothetical protein
VLRIVSDNKNAAKIGQRKGGDNATANCLSLNETRAAVAMGRCQFVNASATIGLTARADAGGEEKPIHSVGAAAVSKLIGCIATA